MPLTWATVMPALAGAIAQEALHWYRLRGRLERPGVRRLLRSPGYWIATTVMIAVSGLGTALVYGARIARPDALFVLGAAFPMLLEKLIAGAIARAPGPAADGAASASWREYLETA